MMRRYLRPTAFVDAPFGLDGRAARLAGGLLWFSAVEIIGADGGRRVSSELVPVPDVGAAIAGDGEAETAWRWIRAARRPLTLGGHAVRLDAPQVMGILNLTPDSFSDGGRHFGDPAAAAGAGVALAADGAAIVDIGGESTRPGAVTVSEGDEIDRVVPVIRAMAAAGVPISIDTRKAGVMEAAVAAGATLINDVSALCYDPRAPEAAARAGCPVVLMHHKGDPETMQQDPRYADALLEVYDWLERRIAAAEAAGIARARLIVDPGIGFGKTLRHNLQLLNGLSLFHGLGCPILLGASRKRMIGALAGEAPVERRLGGSIALALAGAAQGAQLLRVHDVYETVQALHVWRGQREEALTPPA